MDSPMGTAGMDDGRKTEEDYWNGVHAGRAIRPRLPSGLVIGTRNVQHILRPHLRPGIRVLEIGCAPGKYLAWAASITGTEAAGLDYSKPGVDLSRWLFKALELRGDIREEDVFQSSFPPASFDLVYSLGVIEHFDDPRPLVKMHVDFLKPNGTALIAVPNYGGVYGKLQQWADASLLGMHNLSIMSCDALARLAPQNDGNRVDAFPTGRVDPAVVTWSHRMPGSLAKVVQLALNTAGLLQPIAIPALAPFLVLRITRNAQ
jgi:2-polyprenyl-3-methyl-5-hydroxy-6-metoxy-1,4-benzoquinol methylase